LAEQQTLNLLVLGSTPSGLTKSTPSEALVQAHEHHIRGRATRARSLISSWKRAEVGAYA
jgi:hypothetical protein